MVSRLLLRFCERVARAIQHRLHLGAVLLSFQAAHLLRKRLRHEGL